MCVQRFDDSLNSAIHITYRISLRSSSLPEPRDPLLKVLFNLTCSQTSIFRQGWLIPAGGAARERAVLPARRRILAAVTEGGDCARRR